LSDSYYEQPVVVDKNGIALNRFSDFNALLHDVELNCIICSSLYHILYKSMKTILSRI